VAEAGRDATSQARAVGIPRVFVRGNQLFEEFPDGRTEIVPSQYKKAKEGYFQYKNSAPFMPEKGKRLRILAGPNGSGKSTAVMATASLKQSKLNAPV